MLIKPKALQEGDTVAAITSSWGGPSVYPNRYEAGKKQLAETFNLNVVETKHALKDADWIYNNPKARADDLMEAFADPSIKAIISTIGGDESVRILPYLDLDVIKNNPKIYLGYSDSTITHMACYKAGLSSIYGPAIMAGFAENAGIFPYMEQSVRKTLFNTEAIGIIEPSEGWTVEHLNWTDPKNQNIKRKLTKPTGPKTLQGTTPAQGHLIGGCIEVLEFIKGTEWWPELDEWRGAILFLETSEDMPKVEDFTYWVRNYGSQGILQEVNGIILARPGGQTPLEEIEKYDEALKQVVHGELGLTDLPILTQMDFGHTDPMFLIPYGAKAEINPANTSLKILENAVI